MSRRFIVQRCACARNAPRMRFLGKKGYAGQVSMYQCPRCGRIRHISTRTTTRKVPRKGTLERIFDAIFGGN